MNRSIFRPIIGRRNRKGDEVPAPDANEAYHKIMRNDSGDNLNNGDSLVSTSRTKQRSMEQRKRYQFDATASDDELEDEVDNNLDEIYDMTVRLGNMGREMQGELTRQTEYIDVIDGKTGHLDDRIRSNTERVRCYSKLTIFI